MQGFISKDQIVKDDFPEDFFSLIVMDNFKTSQKEIDYFSKFAKVISIDDGAGKKVLKKIAYTLNIIPSDSPFKSTPVFSPNPKLSI